jgi:hypothetical protein
MMGLLFEFSIW